jgi:hypothetical protein
MKSVDDGEAEVLIFDNGSADGTPNFLRQTKNDTPYGTIMLSKNNLGQCVSRNKLVQAAKGAYVLFLDGDVIPIHGSIEEMLDILVSNDQWPGVYYDVHGDIYDEAGATPVELPITMADMSTSPVPMFHYAVYDRGFLNAHPLPEFYPFDGPGWGVEEEMCGLAAGHTPIHQRLAHSCECSRQRLRQSFSRPSPRCLESPPARCCSWNLRCQAGPMNRCPTPPPARPSQCAIDW